MSADNVSRARELAKTLGVTTEKSVSFQTHDHPGVWQTERTRMFEAIISALDAAETRGRIAGLTWNTFKDQPKVGGQYLVGGYVTGEQGPRYFDWTRATLFIFESGYEWRVHPSAHHIPLQYWIELPPHPEHIAIDARLVTVAPPAETKEPATGSI